MADDNPELHAALRDLDKELEVWKRSWQPLVLYRRFAVLWTYPTNLSLLIRKVILRRRGKQTRLYLYSDKLWI